MGEVADMMLDGTLCECCGTYLGKPVGYPRYCENCKPQEKKRPVHVPARTGKKK